MENENNNLYRFVSETDKAYSAGIIDGEGSIMITDESKVKSGTALFVLLVVVSNTDINMLYKLKSVFGGTIMSDGKMQGNRKQGFRWSLTSRRAWMFLETITPYLITKRERAELAVEFGKRVSKKSGFHSSIGGTTNDEIDARRNMMLRMKELNKKGITEVSIPENGK